MSYSPHERRLLSRYFSVVDKSAHADVYLVRNLPPEVAATLNGVYSRSQLSMRDNFLTRLKKGLQEAGRTLEDLDVGEAPRDVLTDVLADKSGTFLKTYAIDHGHNSLREGSVLHIAVENVSQLVTRFIQRERRCSFEESSTRYISFSNESHWRDPDVMAAGGPAAAAYERTIDTTFALYQRATDMLLGHLERKRPLRPDEKPGAYRRAIKAEAFDAARYLLTPALLTKWGMVVDARTLSDMISELKSHPLHEFRLVGERLKEQGDHAVRTLLAHARADEFTASLYEVLPGLAAECAVAASASSAGVPAATLLTFDPELDTRLLASLLYESDHRSFAVLQQYARSMTDAERKAVFARALARRGRRDPLPLAFEGAQPFEFELMVDFGAYRDIGRHRKGLQQQQPLTTEHGFVVPPLIDDAGLGDEFRATLEQAAADATVVARAHGAASGYVTPFAFLQRVRLLFDPRQVAYFIELRSGPEGHFAYRHIAIEMFRAVERVSPLFASLIRAQIGSAFLGRMDAEQGADDRRRQRMQRAGDLPAEDPA